MTTTRENSSEIAPEIVVVNLRDLTETRQIQDHQTLQNLCNNHVIIENTTTFICVVICVSFVIYVIYNLFVFVT